MSAKKAIVVLFLSIGIASCSSLSWHTPKENELLFAYFPPGLGYEFLNGRVDTGFYRELNRTLINLEEEPLCEATLRTHVYRFTILNPYKHTTLLRFDLGSENVTVISKEYDDSMLYEVPKSNVIQKTTIPLADWKSIESELDKINFWKTSIREQNIPGNDGEIWVIEGKRKNECRAIYRVNPQPLKETIELILE